MTLPYSGIADAGDEVDWETVKSTPPEDWSADLKAQIAAAGHDVEAIAERVRQYQQQEATREEPSREDRIWRAAMSTDPDEWSDRLKAAILELRPGSTIEEIAEAIRQRQQAARDKAGSDLDVIGHRIRAAVQSGDMTPEEGRKKMEEARQAADEGGGDRLREFQRQVAARAMATAPEEWSDELKAAIARAGWDLDEFTEGIRQRQAAVRTESSRDDGIDWRAAMATAPEEWSDELKAQITAAGYNLEEIAEGIRQRQAAARESSDPSSTRLESQTEKKTAVEESSWGRKKKEYSDPK